MEGRKRSEVMNGTNELLEKMDQAASILDGRMVSQSIESKDIN